MYKKRIDNLGRVVIPKVIRENLGLDCDDFVNIKLEDNKIIINKEVGISDNNAFQGLVYLLKIIFNAKVLIKNNLNKIVNNDDKNINLENELIIIDDIKYYKTTERIVKNSMTIGEVIILTSHKLTDKDKELIKKIINYFANL